MKAPLILILHDIRSAHNVGSIFRTADGAGVDEIILTGYTPCPPKPGTLYLSDADKALQKTALGAETSVPWRQVASLPRLLTRLHIEGYELVALEQMPGSIDYRDYRPGKHIALILGNEVEGVAPEILKRSDHVIEIPMYGAKNSLNVSVATGIALYQIISTMKR